MSMMEFRRKITFFWYIYYLTVSKDEYCALSALWRRYREPYCHGALLHLLLVMTCKKCSLSRLVSVKLHHFMSSPQIRF